MCRNIVVLHVLSKVPGRIKRMLLLVMAVLVSHVQCFKWQWLHTQHSWLSPCAKENNWIKIGLPQQNCSSKVSPSSEIQAWSLIVFYSIVFFSVGIVWWFLFCLSLTTSPPPSYYIYFLELSTAVCNFFSLQWTTLPHFQPSYIKFNEFSQDWSIKTFKENYISIK